MRRLYGLLALVTSVLLYWMTPTKYDNTFCVACFMLFLIVSTVILVDDCKRIGFFNFNLLFLFSFFACTYVYPVFLVNQNSIIGDLVANTLSSMDTVNKSASLSTLAISIYGTVYIYNRTNGRVVFNEREIVNATVIFRRSRILTLVLCMAMLLSLIIFFNTPHDVNTEVNDSALLHELFDSVIPIFLVCSAIFYHCRTGEDALLLKYIKINRLFFISLLVIVLLFLLIGDRAPIINITTMIMGTVSLYIKKIKLKTFFLIGIIGIFLMFAISETRQGASSLRAGGGGAFVQGAQESLSGSSSIWDVFSDLVGEVRELNEGIHYVEHRGYLYPEANALLLIAAPIPYLPSFIVKQVYNIDLSMIKSGSVLRTYNNVGGNHCVVDIYMPFGVLGIIIVFSIFGFMVAKTTNGLSGNLFCKIFYIYLIGSSIFTVRNSLTSFYRAIVFAFVFYSLFLFIEKINRRV